MAGAVSSAQMDCAKFNLTAKRGFQKMELSDKTENLCSHLQTLKLHHEHVKELFPDYFSSDHDFDDAAG